MIICDKQLFIFIFIILGIKIHQDWDKMFKSKNMGNHFRAI